MGYINRYIRNIPQESVLTDVSGISGKRSRVRSLTS